LWVKIVTLCKYHNVTFHWVKGHSTNMYNNLADLYTNISANVINPEKDEI
jgi:ribonuclease HI